MYKIPNAVIKNIEKTLETWRVELTAGGKSLTEIKIQRCIFQGDSPSPFLFVIAIMDSITFSGNSKPDTNSVNRKKR